MMTEPKRHPFEATREQLVKDIEGYVDIFIAGLQSFFVVMPKGTGFVEYERFSRAYERLREKTSGFETLSEQVALDAIAEDPLVLVVLRTMTGLTPPELAHLARAETGSTVDQSAARRIDKRARDGNDLLVKVSDGTRQQVKGLVAMAVRLVTGGARPVGPGTIHRLDKVDTREGLAGAQRLAADGVPYQALLYERFLGRPFATHRDAVSEMVGEVLENAVEGELRARRIPFHKAAVAERFEDMDQAPDFLVPDEMKPFVVIEAKLAEDDGTARDKVTRVQHLAEIRERRLRGGSYGFDVIACVDGRGFGIRREDVKKLILATGGKLFSLSTIERLIDNTSLKDFEAAD